MLRILPEDIQQFSTWPLQWRFDEPILIGIRGQVYPLSKAKSEQIAGILDAWLQRGAHTPLKAINIAAPEAGTRFLGSLGIPRNLWVILSWDKSIAAITKWDVFIENWDDFCYPSSDDIGLLLQGRKGVLEYRHWEQFSFYDVLIDEDDQIDFEISIDAT